MSEIMGSNNEYIRDEISVLVANQTARAKGLAEQGLKPDLSTVDSMDLDTYKSAFSDIEGAIDEDLAEKYLDSLRWDRIQNPETPEMAEAGKISSLQKIKNRFPPGTKVQLALLPCDLNGRLLTEDEYKTKHAHFKVLIIDSDGLCLGMGNIDPSAHRAILPADVQEQCSFTVAGSLEDSDEAYFETFEAQFWDAFRNLQSLLS